ncbi:MAG: metallopeptidase family protein [Opitutaceae bacterium]|nr:metallopeptidase family protein [Opitutaceae bacterium]
MTFRELTALAESTVSSIQQKLPEALRSLAQGLPVVYHDWPSDEILGEEFDPDILGMFVGAPYGSDTGAPAELPPHILLFLENLWDCAEGNHGLFAREVKLTYLHELGHYLGWDEDEVAARGLE